MTKDYCEILLDAMSMISSKTSRVESSNITINENEETKVPVANPFVEILQDQVFEITEDLITSNQRYVWNFTDAPKYDILGLEYKITTTIPEAVNSLTGNYGIQLTIISSDKTYVTEFDSSEMLGDVFNFVSMLQKKSFDLTEISNIYSIQLALYNNTNINVEFKDIKLRIGYNLNTFGKASEPLVLYAEDGELEYAATGAQKRLLVRYLYQENESWRAVNHNNSNDLPAGTTIRWYRYTPNSPQGDEWGGAYWAYISGQNNKFEYMATNFDSAKENEQFKVVALIGNDTGSVITTLTSKPVVFENHIEGLYEQLVNRSILFMDNTNGVYPYYYPTEEVNKEKSIIPDQLYQAYINRILKLNYTTDLTDQELWESLRSVEWQIPKSLAPAGEQGAAAADNGTYYSWKQEVFVSSEIEDYKQALSTVFTFEYRILTSLGFSISNTIKCIVGLSDGQSYEFTADIAPTIAGSGGTDNSVIVELKDSNGAPRSAIVPGETLYLYPKVFDNEMNRITELTVKCEKYLPDENGDKWTLATTSSGGKWAISASYKVPDVPDFDTPLGTLIAVKFTFMLDKQFSSIDGSVLKIEEIVPIGLTERENASLVYQGPRSIVYDSAGCNPQYNKTPPGLCEKDVISIQSQTIDVDFPTISGGKLYPKNSFDKKFEEKLYGISLNIKDEDNSNELDFEKAITFYLEQNIYGSKGSLVSIKLYQHCLEEISIAAFKLKIPAKIENEIGLEQLIYKNFVFNPQWLGEGVIQSITVVETEDKITVEWNREESKNKTILPDYIGEFQYQVDSKTSATKIDLELKKHGVWKRWLNLDDNANFETTSDFVANDALKVVGTTINIVSNYTQPIIIRQNRYFSSIINEWDGSLQVDEAGNRIMAAAYVAGSKNEENQFTGLIMGEMGKLSLTETKANVETGLFGYSEGAQTFGFRTNGTGFIGRSGKGQILFDGNSGVIQSGNFNIGEWLTPLTNQKDATLSYDFKIAGIKYTLNSDYMDTGKGSLLDLETGNLFVANGIFTGTIRAEAGKIGLWQIGDFKYPYASWTYNTDGTLSISSQTYDTYSSALFATHKKNSIEYSVVLHPAGTNIPPSNVNETIDALVLIAKEVPAVKGNNEFKTLFPLFSIDYAGRGKLSGWYFDNYTLCDYVSRKRIPYKDYVDSGEWRDTTLRPNIFFSYSSGIEYVYTGTQGTEIIANEYFYGQELTMYDGIKAKNIVFGIDEYFGIDTYGSVWAGDIHLEAANYLTVSDNIYIAKDRPFIYIGGKGFKLRWVRTIEGEDCYALTPTNTKTS